MKGLLEDLRYAARVLVKAPRFSLTIIVTLAIGIGVNAANFSIVNAFLLRPQPYADADELVHVWHSDRKWDSVEGRFSMPTIQEMAEACDGCAGMAFYNYFNANIAGGEELPESVIAARLSQNMLPLLGVDPKIGRGFADEDVVTGRSLLLSQGLWQRRFGGREDALGQTLELNDETYTVIGVMPEEFSFPYGGVKAWVVIQPHADLWGRDYRNFMPVVRMKAGVSREQLATQLENAFLAISERHYASEDGEPYVTVEPLREALLFLDDMVHLMLVLLTVAAFFVLLIICTNVANLFLVRATGRQREIAVRAALGAGRVSLVRQLLAEGLVLALVGGALGTLLAYWLMGLAGPAIPEDLYRVGEIEVDGTVLAFSLAVSALTVLLFALPPALQTLKTDLNLALKEGSAGAGVGVKARRVQSVLVVAQVALAVVLLVSTALVVRSFANMDGVDPGFEPDNVLTMGLLLPKASFGEDALVEDFNRELVERVAALPGVESAALTAPLPMNFEQWSLRFTIEGQEDASESQLGAALQVVSPGYFDTTGISMLTGRDFDSRDGAVAQAVAIVNQTMAERYWPGASPLGRRLRYESGDETVVASIVGVVEDTKQMFLNDESGDIVYLSQTQSPRRNPWLLVKTAGDPMAMTSSVREQIWSLRDQLPVSEIRTLREVVDQSLKPWSWSAMILAAFSAFALLLASIGIYGVVAYTATQRTTEIGIRMAMGAQPRDVLRFVMGQALLLTVIGVGIGAVASLALSRAMTSLLFGIGSTDPLAYGVVLAVLGGVTLLAAFGPARRAARTDPSLILRYE